MIRRDILNANQTEREKLLHVLVKALSVTATRTTPPERSSWDVDPHVAFYRRAEAGDLAIGMSGEIGWIRSVMDTELGPLYVVKELGREGFVNWTNETFHPIVGIDAQFLLEGEQRQFQDFAVDAINNGQHGYSFYYAGIKFQNIPDDYSVTIRLRRRFFQQWHLIKIENYRVFIFEENGKERFQQYLLERGWADESLYKAEE